ncbi:MAG: hypothetical protein IKE70_02310, partial [Bacilli bacterium]|nr:hypothetical protein [Bacilli bacterium]
EEEQKKMENTARRYGFDEGKTIGLDEGKTIEKKKIALNLYQNGVDIQTILKSTSLSKEEFDEILKNH